MRRLLIRPGGIGDCILSFPALEFLKADYTEVWVPGDVAPLVRFADRVCSIASTGLDLLGLPETDPPGALLDRLRSFDSIVSWYGANREEFRSLVRELGLPFRFLPALPPAGERMHAADFFLREAGGKGTAVPRIECPSAARCDFAVIHPFSGGARKNWPIAKFRELAGRLSCPVQWCAGPEEVLDSAVRMDSLWDLACWLAATQVYIGNDSGITHLAAAVGTPAVAIFGPSDAAIWGPRGERVHIVSGRLEDIRVDQVLGAILHCVADGG
ncbi:MAG: glycosyltransferase family 9 protein [Acidobacteriia bacterium]|nr:glycosyltransferase family 9 protein [Terriglobia bacterium]